MEGRGTYSMILGDSYHDGISSRPCVFTWYPAYLAREDPPRSRHHIRGISKTFFESRPCGCDCQKQEKIEYRGCRRICRGLSRMRQLPLRCQRSSRHLPFPHLNCNISRHPRVSSTPRSAHPRPCVSLLFLPRPPPCTSPSPSLLTHGTSCGQRPSGWHGSQPAGKHILRAALPPGCLRTVLV